MEQEPKKDIIPVTTDNAESIKSVEGVESLDREIFERLKSIDVSVLPNLKPDFEALKEQKHKFLNGDIDCPYFTYDRLKEIDFDSKELALQTLKDELSTAIYPEPVVRAYKWIINEQIAKVRMLKETKAMADRENSERHATRFTTYSEFIYGEPSQSVFDSTLSYVKNKLDAVADGSELRNTEDFLLLEEMLSRVDHELPDLPHMEMREQGEPTTNLDEIVLRFKQGLEKYGLIESGWKVVVDQTGERNIIAVSQAKKQVLLPNEEALKIRSKARALTPERINGLIEHEIGTHALRAKNGSESEFKLLQTGLDRNEAGEEGLATFREQLETGTDDFAGFHGYFAAGLAKGLDNHPMRNFAEVFTVLKAYFLVCEGETDEKAKELAWLRVLRTFRGTNGQVPGAIFTKDILYREGNMAIHKLHQQGLLDHDEVNIGKYDINNERHKSVLREIGIPLKS